MEKEQKINLEQRLVSNESTRISSSFNVVKKYLGMTATGIALALAPAYLSSCEQYEETECCMQLNCGTYVPGSDYNQECMSTNNSIYKEQLCVTLEDGTEDCCRCMPSSYVSVDDDDEF
jgi:hypothetical protein